MKNVMKRGLVLLFMLCSLAVFSGCQENNQKAKLVFAKNMELTKQVETKNEQIEILAEKLTACEEKNKELQNQIGQKNMEMVNMLMETMGKENAKLVEENKKLKAKIEELQQ